MYNNEFYKKLNKPANTPSPPIFKAAWGFLYILMIISFILIIREQASTEKALGILFFGIQLILNLLWAPVFFILENIKLAFIIAVTLTFCVAVTIFLFAKISIIAAFLLIPYLIWMIFACFLNFNILQLND